MRGRRGVDWTEIGVAAWAVAILGWPILLGDDRFLATFWIDDAYYYAQIARHVAAGHGFTFDGLHATTGFQPLWQWIEIPIVALVPGDVPPMRAIAMLEVLLVAGASVAVLRALEPRVGRAAALAGALLLAAQPGALGTFAAGMESALLLATLVAAWHAWLALERDDSLWAWTRLGLVCALAAITRFEAGALIPVIALAERRRLGSSPGRALRLGAPAVAAAFALLAWNHARIGLWLPVSGLVKAHSANTLIPLRDRIRFLWDVPWFGQQAVVLAVHNVDPETWSRRARIPWEIALAVFAVLLVRGRRLLGAAIARAHVGVPIGAAAAIVLLDKVTVFWIEPWERVPILLATALLLAALLAERPRAARVAVPLTFAMGLIVTGVLAVQLRDPRIGFDMSHYRIAVGRWLRANVEPEARIGSWNAGQIAWFSHRTVVNLDGFVNDGEYFHRAIELPGLAAVLRDERIDLLADQACGPVRQLPYYLEAFGAGDIAAEFSVAIAFVHPDTPDGCPGAMVWRRPHLAAP